MTTPSKPQPSAHVQPASSGRPPAYAPNHGTPRRRPLRILTIALVVSGLLVAPAFAFNHVFGSNGSAGLDEATGSSVDEAQSDPAGYTARTVQQVAGLSSIDVAGAAGVPLGSLPGAGLPAGLEAQAQASLDAAIAAAMLSLEEALAAATLPEVPLDYVAGMPIDVRLPASAGYTLPALPGGPAVQSFAGSVIESAPSPVGTRQSTNPLEDALAQVQTVQSTIEGILGDLPTGELLGNLPLNQVGAPAQAQGATDSVDPDEEGALLATRHATALLDATSQAYATTAADLTGLLAAYEGLALRLEEAIEMTRQVQEDATGDIQATLDERLTAIDREARTLTGQATRIVAEHQRLVGKIGAQADAAVRTAYDAQVAGIMEARDEAVGNVTARIQAVLAQAESRKADVREIVDAATADLGAPGASDAALYGLEAVKAAGTAAVLKIDREARAEVQALGEVRADIEAEAAAMQRDLAKQVTAASATVNRTLAGALEGSADVKAYLLEYAQARAQALEERELELAAQAVAKLEANVDAHVSKLVRASMKSTESANKILASTMTLVGTVENVATTEVDKDLKYIGKVSEDYGRVPTEDRKERASHWSTTVATLDGLLGDALVDGQNVERLARQAVEAAMQAQAEIEAMA